MVVEITNEIKKDNGVCFFFFLVPKNYLFTSYLVKNENGESQSKDYEKWGCPNT
jgi:hypothetical protein